MKVPGTRCSYYHEAAIWTRTSITIKHRQTTPRCFQNEILRTIFGIKHAYFSRIRNQHIIATANQETKLKNNKEIIKM